MLCKSQPVKVGENARHSHAEYIPQNSTPHPPEKKERIIIKINPKQTT